MDAGLSSLITGLVAGLGIGTAITALIQHSLKLKESTHESQRKDLEARYKVVILLMYAAFDFAGNGKKIRLIRPDLRSKQDVLEELEAEWTNMILFSSPVTLKSLRQFIKEQTREHLLTTAFAMRKDLGRGKIKPSEAA
jgi:hypothetical protein